MQTEGLLPRLERVVRTRGLVRARLVVGVSGGPDSVALALLLASLQERLGFELHLAHVDHQLRPDSRDDAEYVRTLAARLGFPAIVHSSNWRARAASGPGVEEEARNVRYHFFGQLCQSLCAAAVLVGHTADDQVETRLLHVVRGSGLGGLKGMAVDTMLRLADGVSVRVVRPLLTTRRSETEAFCLARGVQPRRDPSNDDTVFARNRLRHQVVPTLWSINPRLDDSLERLARLASDADAFVESTLATRLSDLAVISERAWRVDRRAWRGLHQTLKRALFRRAAASLDDATSIAGPQIGGDAVDAAIHAADTWPAGKVLTWPGGLVVRVEYDYFTIERGVADALAFDPRDVDVDRAAEYPIGVVPTTMVAPGVFTRPWMGTLRVKWVDGPCRARSGDRWHLDIDRAKLAGTVLTLRSRQLGDWIALEGSLGRKKLQDILVDAHVPRTERHQVRVLATSDGIAWIVGLRRDRRYLAGPESRDVRCLQVELEPLTTASERRGREEVPWAT